VKAGDVIAEIETDKATMDVEAVDEGKVGRLLVAEGTEGVKVNTPIAVLLAEGESAGAAPAPKAQPSQPAARADPASRPAAEESAAAAAPAAAPAPAEPQAPRPARAAAPNGRGRILASPLARRLAKEAGLDLAALTGSGPHGRIIKSDVETAARNGAAAAAPGTGTAVTARPAPGIAPPPAMPDAQILALYEKGSYEAIPHDNMRKVIAQRLTLSKQTIPHFRLTVDCNIDDLLKARERMNAASP
jgi:pyruvate dehydrogenase E2 component (dihydrolipoamide acetyltransferase)